MLFPKHIICLKQLCTIARLTNSLPIKWSKSHQKFYFINNHVFQLKKLAIKCSLIFTTVLVICFQLYYSSFSNLSSLFKSSGYILDFSEIFQIYLVLLMVAYMPAYILILFVLNRATPHVVNYINGHIHLSKLFWKSNAYIGFPKTTLVHKLNIFIAYCLAPWCILAPLIVIFGIHWYSPCKPSLVGYWLLHECKEIGLSSTYPMLTFLSQQAFKFIIFTFNYWAHTTLFSIAPLLFSGLLIFCSMNLERFIQVLKLSKFTSDFMTNYRSIQVLSSILLDVRLSVILGVLSVSLVVAQAFCLTIFTSLLTDKRLNTISNIFFVVSFMGCFYSLMGILGIQSRVYTASKQMIIANKQCITMDKGRPKRMKLQYLRSCYPIKIGLNLVNFVDRVTPLVCIDYANDLTVNLLLVR